MSYWDLLPEEIQEVILKEKFLLERKKHKEKFNPTLLHLLEWHYHGYLELRDCSEEATMEGWKYTPLSPCYSLDSYILTSKGKRVDLYNSDSVHDNYSSLTPEEKRRIDDLETIPSLHFFGDFFWFRKKGEEFPCSLPSCQRKIYSETVYKNITDQKREKEENQYWKCIIKRNKNYCHSLNGKTYCSPECRDEAKVERYKEDEWYKHNYSYTDRMGDFNYYLWKTR